MVRENKSVFCRCIYWKLWHISQAQNQKRIRWRKKMNSEPNIYEWDYFAQYYSRLILVNFAKRINTCGATRSLHPINNLFRWKLKKKWKYLSPEMLAFDCLCLHCGDSAPIPYFRLTVAHIRMQFRIFRDVLEFNFAIFAIMEKIYKMQQVFTSFWTLSSTPTICLRHSFFLKWIRFYHFCSILFNSSSSIK